MVPIQSLLRDNLSDNLLKPDNLQPVAYFTDGGTYNDDSSYFIHNVFQKTLVCHSSKAGNNVNVQAYFGKSNGFFKDAMAQDPKTHKVGDDPNKICLSLEDCKYEEEEENFKRLTELVLHNKGSGYTCFVNSFCLFLSEKEIKVHKSKIVKLFNDVNTIEKFKSLGLPIAK